MAQPLVAGRPLDWGVVLFLGYAIRRFVPPLARYNLPAPVIGGLVVSLVVLAARSWDRSLFVFDTTLSTPLMIAFFTTIGFGASLGLLRKGGPHVHRPRHSPVPHHVHLDSYAAIVDGHGDHGPTHALVVPGEPLASRLVTVLLDPTMQMPPGVGMPDEEIQLIASWVAQGAKDN